MSRRSRRQRLPQEPQPATIDDLSHDGRGIAHIDGKAVFIPGALPGEQITFQYRSRRKQFDEGQLLEVIQASDDRVEAECAHFGICAGCALQHLHPEKQIAFKHNTLRQNLLRIGKVEPENWLTPLRCDDSFGYRRKARMSVRAVKGKGRVLVGFREHNGRFVADIARCEVLDRRIGPLIAELADTIDGMEKRDRIAQVEVAGGDDRLILLFRNLDPLSETDQQALIGFGDQHDLDIWLQPGGPKTIFPIRGEGKPMHFSPQPGIDLHFLPSDFVQVNAEMNQKMVAQALDLLALEKQETVLDLFCGLGNFSLPMAKLAKAVVGVEGEQALVDKAQANAALNEIGNTAFFQADLREDPSRQPWAQQAFDKILLDPPRSGAQEVVPHILKLAPKRIVYVSCHPGSLARDAGMLVEGGYKLTHAGAMDMFPHTAHVESMAVFDRQ